MKFVPTIYPITDRTISGLSHLEQVKRLADGGAQLIQLRDKTATSGDFYRAAAEVMSFAAEDSHLTIIINDRVDIALACGADGVHLGQDDLPPTEARSILGENAIIGISTHSVEQAIAALKEPVDYVAVGPVFQTASKENPDPAIGLDGLRLVKSRVGERPLVAIGGINFANAQQVIDAGADSVAIISDILRERGEIAGRVQRLLENTRRNASTVG